MRRTLLLVAAAAILVATFPALFADDADAVDDGDEYYCYGDSPTLTHDRDLTGRSIKWTVTGIPNGGGDRVQIGVYTTPSITIDIDGYQHVEVTQEVTDEKTGQSVDMTISLIPLHLLEPGEEFEVRFIDGSRLFDSQTIDNTTVVKKGANHVVMPAPPEKDGYEFENWFEDQEFTKIFNPKLAVHGDLTLYAKWTSAGGDIPTPPVDVDFNLVTFDITPGLEYTLIGSDKEQIVFTVSVIGGYRLVGEVNVTASSGSLTSSNGVYTLGDINEDVVVTVDGQVELRGGGTTTVVIQKSYTVTFDTTTGLEYTVQDVGSDSVRFVVDVAEGFVLCSDLSVTSNSGTISQQNGEFVLSNIQTNTVITIDGEMVLESGGNVPDDGDGFPWIYILLVVIVIAVIAVILAYRLGRSSS